MEYINDLSIMIHRNNIVTWYRVTRSDVKLWAQWRESIEKNERGSYWKTLNDLLLAGF